MNQKQKKYTVYEIEKLTKGKLTKYKLTKAIHANELRAEEVKEKKRGRGIPNFFIYENDLNDYLQKIEENKKHYINIPQDMIYAEGATDETQSEELQGLLKRNIETIENVERKLVKLEEDYTSIIPLLEKQQSVLDTQEEKTEERREIIDELISMPSFMVKKRKELLNKLHQIS